jgi:hypothetical protein
MPLADEIAALRDVALADLDEAHDYYTNTKAAWRVVQRYVERGGKVRVHNRSTGGVTTEKELPAKAQQYVTEYLTAATFQQFVSVFEVFVFGVMRQWLLAYPQRLERKQIPVSVVLTAADLASVKLAAVNRELNELSYKRVREWFAYLEDLVKLGRPTADEVDRLAEIKATRDVYVHSRGTAGAVYVEKAGARKRCDAGQKLDLPEQYHRESWQLIRKVIADISAAAIAKA